MHGLCKALVARGDEVHVFTTNVDGPNESAVPLDQTVHLDGVAVTYFPTSRPRRIYRSPAMARRLTKTVSNFDLVHIHAMFLWPGLAASKAARKAGVPYVVSPRGMLVPSLIARKSRLAKQAWLHIFDHKMLRNAAALHVTSDLEQDDMRSLGIRARRVLVIPNGIDIPAFNPDSKEREKHVLYLGRLDRKKGIEVLLRAMARLPDVPLVIAGDGEKTYVDALKRLTSELALEDRVTFLGHLEDEAKWREYRRAGLFALPSVSENFANVVLEAMAAGCPVLVSPGVGLAETVANQHCGRVVQREPGELAAAIRELLDDPEARKKMSSYGMKAAKEFAWDHVARKMAAAYQQLTSRPETAQRRTRLAQ